MKQSLERGRTHGIQQEKSYHFGLAIVIAFYGILHIFTKSGLLNDTQYLQLDGLDEIIDYMTVLCQTWFGRIVVHFAASLVSQLPFIVWQVCDTLMFAVIYWGIHTLLEVKGSNNILLAMGICSYIFLQMASAGWVITTAVYVWTLATGLVCLVLLKKTLNGEQMSIAHAIIYGVCMIYTCNYEIMAGVMLIVYLSVLIWELRQKNNKGYLYSGIVIQAISILFLMTNPGNKLRFASELAGAVDYQELSLLGKLRIGMVSTYEHFVSIPNVIFAMVCLIIVCIVWSKQSSLKDKLIAAIPLGCDVVLTIYYLVKDILLGGKRNYVFDEPPMIPATTEEWMRQGILIGLFLLSGMTILYSIWRIVEEKKEFWLMALVLAAGLASRMAMCFSPSVYASGTRTFMELYFAFIIVFVFLLKYLKDKRMYVLLTGGLCCGMIVNFVLTVIPYLQGWS